MDPAQSSTLDTQIDSDPPDTPLERAFTDWRFDAAIDRMVEQFVVKPGEQLEASETLDALLRSAFERAWSAGYEKAME